MKTDSILFTATPVSNGAFLSLRLYVSSFKRRFTFYVNPSFFVSCIGNLSPATVTDLHNILTFRLVNKNPQLHFMFIESTFSGRISGYETYLRISEETLTRLASGETFRILVHDGPGTSQALITFSDSAMRRIAAFDKPHLRAFVKCLRSHFHWEGSRITIYADFGADFCFKETVNGQIGICGGVCLSTITVPGKDGNDHAALRYTVHT